MLTPSPMGRRRLDDRAVTGHAFEPRQSSWRAALDRHRMKNPANGESEENGEVDQACRHGGPEEEDLPVQDLCERGATPLKQGEKLYLVVWRGHEILGADRPLDKKREARRYDVTRIDRQDEENDREQRKQQQQK